MACENPVEKTMAEDRETEVTEIVTRLKRAGGSDRASAEELLPYVYDELRMLARKYLSRERPGHTLQPTALVHEAYIKLVDQSKMDWQGRTHFFAVGAKVMRHLLIDHARGKGRAKRGGDRQKVTLADGSDALRRPRARRRGSPRLERGSRSVGRARCSSGEGG